MTNTYKTLNPLGSNNARDLSDNASNFDEYMNSDLPSIKDRFDKRRETLAGNQVAFDDAQEGRAQEFTEAQSEREAAFHTFLEGTGWSSIGAYASGISIVSHTQTVDYLGQPYALKPSVPASISSPYVTTGNWATEGVNFKLVGDNSLRQDLKAPAGSDEIGYRSALAEAIGSAISRMVRGRLDDIISSADVLVGGDVNDSVAMQALVDRISSTGGGCIYMPHNKYTMSWIPKRYVSYVGATWGATRNVSGSGAVNRWGTVIVAPDGAPWICDTGVGGALSIGFLGIDFQGKGLSGAGGGLNLRAGTNNPIVRSCGFNNFAEQAIVMNGQIGHFTDLVGTNCLLNRTRTVKSGVFEIRGADNFADNIQGNTGITGIVSSDLFLCGILIGGANNYYHNLEGELSEVGIHIETTGAIHKLVNCRADLNFGHGFSGFGYMAANCHALNNGTAATNTYNGWDIGPRSILTGCTSDSGGTNRVKYGFGFQTGADSAAEGSQPSLNGCRSIGHATAAFDDSLFNGFAHVMFSGWLRGTALTPDVSGRKTYAAVNSTAAVITGFVGGVKGQELTVYANANVSFQRNADFIISGTKANGLKQCVAQRAYQFLCVAKASGGSMWIEVGGRDPAVGTTAERPSAFAYPGMIYLDTTLGRPIMRNNTGWIDFSGISV